jgi:hypothetical protein
MARPHRAARLRKLFLGLLRSLLDCAVRFRLMVDPSTFIRCRSDCSPGISTSAVFCLRCQAIPDRPVSGAVAMVSKNRRLLIFSCCKFSFLVAKCRQREQTATLPIGKISPTIFREALGAAISTGTHS